MTEGLRICDHKRMGGREGKSVECGQIYIYFFDTGIGLYYIKNVLFIFIGPVDYNFSGKDFSP